MKPDVFKSMMVLLMATFIVSCNVYESETIGNESIGDGDTMDNYDDVEIIDVPIIQYLDLTESEQSTNEGLNKFSITFFNKVADCENNSDQKSNFSVSPVSAFMSLAILANTTDKNFENAVCNMLASYDLESLNNVCNKLMRYLPIGRTGYEFRLANSIWYDGTMNPSQNWKDLLLSNYYASVNSIDIEDPNNVDKINRWCEGNTKGLIDKIIDTIDPCNSLVVLNALYFYSKWWHMFDSSLTYDASFYGKSKTSSVDMMHTDVKSRYYSTTQYDATELSLMYGTEMLFYLPKEGVDVMDLARQMSYEDYLNLTQAGGALVHLDLPKFKIDTKIDITDVLSKIGIPSEVRLDKMGVDRTIGLCISQNASIEIDEEGAKAAAVTEVNAAGAYDPDVDREISLTFNRPFLYIIYNSDTKSIIMAGVVNNIN